MDGCNQSHTARCQRLPNISFTRADLVQGFQAQMRVVCACEIRRSRKDKSAQYLPLLSKIPIRRRQLKTIPEFHYGSEGREKSHEVGIGTASSHDGEGYRTHIRTYYIPSHPLSGFVGYGNPCRLCHVPASKTKIADSTIVRVHGHMGWCLARWEQDNPRMRKPMPPRRCIRDVHSFSG